MTSERVEIGRVGRAHGLRGEVVVDAITNRDERFAPGSMFYVDGIARPVVSARRHQGRWLVGLEGITDRTAAEALRGAPVTADPLGDLPEGEVWVHEMIGSEIFERDGRSLGHVVAVDANPAHDILVTGDGILIPIVFVVEHADGRVVVELPEGLLQLYQ